MIKGVGIDLMNMDRISEDISLDDAFIRKTFTEAELDELKSRKDRHTYLCTRFSMKEAIFKTLGRDGDSFAMTDIEVLCDELGRPTVKLLGKSKELAEKSGISEIFVSVSYDGNLVTSFAVAQGTA